MSEEKSRIKKERVEKNKEDEKVHHIDGCQCEGVPMCGQEREFQRMDSYDELFAFIEREYPKNGDEKFEIILDNGGRTTVSARVFMSIRQFPMEDGSIQFSEEESEEDTEEEDEVYIKIYIQNL